MDKFENFISKHENYNTIISVFNLVCEITEKEKMNGTDKLVYATQMFHVIAKELHRKEKISDELWEQCEKLDEKQVQAYINQVVELWNKAVPIFKKIRKFFRKVINKLKCC
jgi:hypothetical protein